MFTGGEETGGAGGGSGGAGALEEREDEDSELDTRAGFDLLGGGGGLLK